MSSKTYLKERFGARTAKSPKELNQYVNHKEPRVRASAASNILLSEKQIKKLAKDKSPCVQIKLAKNWTTPKELLMTWIHGVSSGTPWYDAKGVSEDEIKRHMFAMTRALSNNPILNCERDGLKEIIKRYEAN